MSSVTKLVFLCATLLYTVIGNAAVVSNFEAIYDVTNNRILYTFDLDPVDAITTTGVDQVYFNYNPQDPPAPFIGTTSLLDAIPSGTIISTVYDTDEINITFPTALTEPSNIQLLIEGVDPASLVGVDYSLDLEVNTTYFSPPSTLVFQSMGTVETQADFTEGVTPSSLQSVPEPVPALSVWSLIILAGLLGLIGYGRHRRRA